MRASRGMGAMSKAKLKGATKVVPQMTPDNTNIYKGGGKVWEKDLPKALGAPKKLSPAKKASAKAMAQKAGRPYPNLVDNMRAARKK